MGPQDTYYIRPRHKNWESQRDSQNRGISKQAPNENRRYLQKKLNEMEASNLSDTEFKAMVIRMLNSIIKDMKSIKKGPGRNEEYNI